MATYDGTPDDNVLLGGDDDDILRGMAGDDTLRGGPGNDVLEGGAGADEVDGGEDDGLSQFVSSYRDLIWGDTATYLDSDAGVTIDLATGTAQGGHAEGDTLTGIESVRASDHADVLVARNEGSSLWGQRGDDSLIGGEGNDYFWGDKGDDTLMGGAGLDYLEGGAGADVLDGGASRDYAGYELSDAGVTVNLATGTVEGGHAEGDTLTSIENVWGSRYADSITGEAGINNFVGGAGADTLDGGAGSDRAWYVHSDAGVTVNLVTGTGQGGHAEGDTLTGIESVWGSHHADHLIGDGHQLFGWFGNDTLEGGAGDDYLDGGDGADMLDGGGGERLAERRRWRGRARRGWRRLEFRDLLELRCGGDDQPGSGRGGGRTRRGRHAHEHPGRRRLKPGRPPHRPRRAQQPPRRRWRRHPRRRCGGRLGLRGDAGADMLIGGAGDDTARYLQSDVGVTVNLATGTAQGGHAEGDTFTGIESIRGSNHADRLTGDAGDNRLDGRDGNDTLAGGAGDDWLEGGPGADMLDGGGGDLDSAVYWGSDAGVTVNLAAGTGQGGEAEGDTLTGFGRVFGSDHADRLIGDSGDNLFHGSGGNDTLEGGAGGDWLNGEAGEDLLTGGEDADTFVFGGGDTVTDFQDGSDLIDIQEDFGHINAVNFDTNVAIRQSGDDVEVQIGDAVLTLTGVSAADVTADDFILADIHGSDHADHFIGDDGNNLIIGSDDADEILGFGGIDLLRGSADRARPTTRSTVGGSGPDSLYGDKDNDTITGGPGDDLIRGGKGDDSLDGGEGRDMIRADLGDDWIFGSEGDDYIDGADGIDVVNYGNSPEPVTIDLSSVGVVIPGTGGYADGDILVNIENIDGSPHNDVISVADDWETLIEHGVWAGGGDDELWGFRGDYLNGGEGDDYLNLQEGGVGVGGPGADTFNLFGDAIEGRIEDFNPDEGDKIRLNEDGFSGVDEDGVQAMLDGSSGDTLDLSLLGIPDKEHTTIVLQDFDVADLTVDDFILL